MNLPPSPKKSWVLTGLSLATNLVLLVALTVAPRRQVTSPPPSPADTPVVVAPARVSPLWGSFEADNPDVLVGQLRAAGFPDDIVRATMAALVKERERLARLVGPAPGPTEAESRQRTLLRRQYGDLPPEKMAGIERIVSDYDALIAASGNKIAAWKERVHLEAAKQADIAQLLTPAERFEYDLRSSATAEYLRWHLENFGTSEAEYRTLFPLFREWEMQRRTAVGDPPKQAPVPGGSTTGQPTEPRSGSVPLPASLLAQIEQLLGPERFAEYRQATGSSWSILPPPSLRYKPVLPEWLRTPP